MNMNFLNHKQLRKDVSFIEGEDNVGINLKEVYNKVNLLEKLLLDEEGVIDNIMRVEKKIDDLKIYENDNWIVIKSRISRVESKFFDLEIKNNELDLKEEKEVKKEEKEEEEEEEEDVLNVTPNPDNDESELKTDDIKIDN